MMKKFLLLLLVAVPVAFIACKKDDDKKEDPKPAAEIPLTQENLNLAIIKQFENKTGVHRMGNDSLVWSHNAALPNPDSTLRTLYTTYPTGAAVQPGAVLAKHVHRRNPDGSRGPLTLVFVMHKQNSGYFPTGGDFNYYVIPGNTVTAALPNGDFSQAIRSVGETNVYGRSTFCADCHARGGSDYLFSR